METLLCEWPFHSSYTQKYFEKTFKAELKAREIPLISF